MLAALPEEYRESIQKIYRNYPEMPYIDPDRDFKYWLWQVGRYNTVVPIQHMQRLDEGLLPGHIILLWRVHFNNITTKSVLNSYFETVYGLEPDEALDDLVNEGYATPASLEDSLKYNTKEDFKRLLKNHGIPFRSNISKPDIVALADQHIPYETQEQELTERLFVPTDDGLRLLGKYKSIIDAHIVESERVINEIVDRQFRYENE